MYKLTRERDNLTKVGKAIKYIEWNEECRVSNRCNIRVRCQAYHVTRRSSYCLL